MSIMEQIIITVTYVLNTTASKQDLVNFNAKTLTQYYDFRVQCHKQWYCHCQSRSASHISLFESSQYHIYVYSIMLV